MITEPELLDLYRLARQMRQSARLAYHFLPGGYAYDILSDAVKMENSLKKILGPDLVKTANDPQKPKQNIKYLK